MPDAAACVTGQLPVRTGLTAQLDRRDHQDCQRAALDLGTTGLEAVPSVVDAGRDTRRQSRLLGPDAARRSQRQRRRDADVPAGWLACFRYAARHREELWRPGDLCLDRLALGQLPLERGSHRIFSRWRLQGRRARTIIANHRLAVDFNGAVTWLDRKDRSGFVRRRLAFTVSQENTATNCRTGDELHLEWAETQDLSKEFSIGLVGYYYDQPCSRAIARQRATLGTVQR